MHSKALARKQRLESRCRGVARSTIGSAAGFATPTFRIADSPNLTMPVRDHIQGAASGRTVARKTCI